MISGTLQDVIHIMPHFSINIPTTSSFIATFASIIHKLLLETGMVWILFFVLVNDILPTFCQLKYVLHLQDGVG